MVIDSHAHIFPYLGGQVGYASVGEHLAICQRAMHEHLVQPARRASDNSIVDNKALWDPNDPSLAGRYDVQFRIGNSGRFEWTQNGEDCYIQYMPPGMERMEASPGWLKGMMDYAGVDRAVLQCAGTYGRLNEYYALVLDEHPELSDVFIPLAQIDEKKAYEDGQRARLRHLIEGAGLRGLWLATGFAGSQADASCFGPRYAPFWNEVRDLGIPVFLAFYPEPAIWMDSLRRLEPWVEAYPEIPCVLPQAFPMSPTKPQDRIDIPEFARRIIQSGNLLVEIVYPIGRGKVEDYPFTVSREAVRALHDTLGPEKLVWGSDIPMVERYCTYAQSLNWLKDYCDFIPPQDMAMILGENLSGLFGR